MIVSISAVVLLGIALGMLIRYGGLRPWHALVAALFGFFAASTTAAPSIRAAIRAVFHALSGHH
jgi:F0F1-type ATP synthase assembly protein I